RCAASCSSSLQQLHPVDRPQRIELVLRELQAQIVSAGGPLERRRRKRRDRIVSYGRLQRKNGNRGAFATVDPHFELSGARAWRVELDGLPRGAHLEVERHLPDSRLYACDMREVDTGEHPARIEDID